MLVIHGIWARDALCLWAEDSARPVTSAAAPGRPSRAPRPHPFAADPETIAGALAVADSVLIGGTLRLAVQDGTGALAAPAPVR